MNIYRIIFEDGSGQDVWAFSPDEAYEIYAAHTAEPKLARNIFTFL